MGGLAIPALAQTEESNWYTTLSSMDSSQLTLLIILGVVLVVIVLLLILMVYLMSFMAAVFKKENPALANEPSWWDSFKTRYRDWETDRKSTRLNSSHSAKSRMPSSA